MPADDQTTAHRAEADVIAPDQPALSRRSMLRTAAGAGAAGLVAGATLSAMPALASTRRSSPATATAQHGSAAEQAGEGAGDDAEPIVVHVRDVRSGDMEIFAGTSEARLRDPALAARLARVIR